MSENTVTNKVIQKKHVNQTHLYWWLGGENSNSYERLQALSFCNALAKNLKLLYPDDEEGLREALERNLEFFNTEGTIGAMVPAITLAMEEKKAQDKEMSGELITNLKLGLMGPIAGIGDTLIWGTMKAIILALGCSFALQGNPLGVVFPFLFTLMVFVIGRYTATLGYNLGTDAVTKMISSGLMNKVIDAASILGLFMMGALSASYVRLSTKLQYTIEATETVISLQKILDAIIPGILPLLAIFGILWYFKNKGQNYVKLIGLIILICMVGALIGVF